MNVLRKFLVLMLCLLTTVVVSADPITREQAQKKAEQYLSNRSGSRRLAPVVNSRRLAPKKSNASASSSDPYYVFNRGESEGYVIVAADNCVEGVMGYTDNGEFDYENLPDNMRAWLNDYANAITAMQTSGTSERRKAITHKGIATLMTTRWNQGDPYNQECPMYFTLGRSVTGCVATAMAQVLYYQRDKSVTETQADMPAYSAWAENPYNGQYLWVEGIPKGSPIDWDNMLDSYNSSSTGVQKKAVAQLMHYCGVSVHMGYTNSSSGAQTLEVVDAMKNYFGYGSSVRQIYRSSYGDVDFDAAVYNELANGRPVLLSGYNSQGGHAFVTDGHDGNQCYHINWGWGGSSDGYFLLYSLNPSNQGIGGTADDAGGYADGLAAIIGCEPDNYMEKEMPISNSIAKRLAVAAFDANADGKLSYGEAAAVTDLGDTFKGQRIGTFNELYYFTGLTSIADDAFNGCIALTEVTLPKKLQHIGNRAFNGCTRLRSINFPDALQTIGDDAFNGCRTLPDFTLSGSLTSIGARAFLGCTTLTTFSLPLSVQNLGEQAFSGCTKLVSFDVMTPLPQTLTLGASVFDGIDLSEATLHVLQGNRAFFSTAEQWKDFGILQEKHDLAQGRFEELVANKNYYLYNVGTGLYLTRGEAYGTQAIVGEEPMRFQLRRSASMAEGVYYLYTNDNDVTDRHWLFRTSTDARLGSGVNGCFTDGTSLTASAYWQVKAIGNNLYTFQVPSNQGGYDATRFMGIQLDHENNNQSPTYGIYSDVLYDNNPLGCQWALVPYDEEIANYYASAKVLEKLLTKAATKRVSVSAEQAVYDNMESPLSEIEKAQYKLRQKLSLINFKDPEMRALAIRYWDSDGDEELSYAEAATVTDVGGYFQGNTAITSLEDLVYFTKLTEIHSNRFQRCTKVTSVILPENLKSIQNYAFNACSKLESIELPEYVYSIGTGAFTQCASLKSVTVGAADPADITLTGTVFTANYVKDATLYVPFGSKELYAAADQWKNFGTIEEVRTHVLPPFSPIEANTPGYIYNLGTHRYLNRGEAWGTQSIVGASGLVYHFVHNDAMGDDVYALATSESKPYIFRTSTDDKVGSGVKTCFSDGSSLAATTYWQVAPAEGAAENVFTLQVPKSSSDYVANEYLGVLTSHTTAYTSNTYGLYWDITLTQGGAGCQWGFIKSSDMKAVSDFNKLVDELKGLLLKADAKNIEATEEHAVYNNKDASLTDLEDAVISVRRKLGVIEFSDSRAEQICLNEWDTDFDGYFTLEEAAAVTNLGSVLNSSAGMKSFDELRFFTGLTGFTDNAFRNSTLLVSAYIPAQIKSLGVKPFNGCSGLKYLAILNKESVVDATEAALPTKLTVFVPKAMVSAYEADPVWGQFTILEYTGIPTVTVEDATRLYGASNPSFTYTISGAPINGFPAFECEADLTSPVGTYPINGKASSITTLGVEYVPGTLTVEKATLKITARSFTRNKGEENPEFTVRYNGWKNSEKVDVLTKLPVIECDADVNSPAGEYEIRVSGAEAENYTFNYVFGVLTVLDPDAIDTVKADGDSTNPEAAYDLSGRKVVPTRPGLYIVNGKKKAVK